MAIRALPHVRVRFSRRAICAAEAALERRRRPRRDIIPYDRYAELCAADGHHLRPGRPAHPALAPLHDLGVVLDFPRRGRRTARAGPRAEP